MAPTLLSDRVAKALSHEARRHALRVFAEGEHSPKEIAARNGAGIERIAHHVRALADLGMVVEVRTEPRRGVVAHYYTLTADGEAAVKIARALDRLDP